VGELIFLVNFVILETEVVMTPKNEILAFIGQSSLLLPMLSLIEGIILSTPLLIG